ncbi:MAG: twin-arginine translocase TatA/TatE family subunit [Deltaproteobacteria bacterium]|nr:twin-arginine translocase TatA/TatE family subunit [Deltaproteobacteria bacterium]MBW2192648.1 twin-arginine translocase TatA/TatE family subunit [Deltaproteobacteria bacterium]
MFGIGMPEMILILAIALIVIGPKNLPTLAKSLGRAFGEFKRATSELKESMEIDTELSDVKKAFDEMNQSVRETIDETAGYADEVKDISSYPKDKNDETDVEKDSLKGSENDETDVEEDRLKGSENHE